MDLSWVAAQFPDLSGITPLGAGGQRHVFACDHQSDGKVVLKLIKPGSDPEVVRREIVATQKLNGVRVPRISGVGTITTPFGECIWLREQRIEGQTLRATLQAGPLSAIAVVQLAVQMLESLAAAEAVQLVHRDVKPENIICDSGGDFWLLDFGIARHLDLQSLTSDHQRWGKGTPGYAAPEQMRNFKRSIDGRADLFGVGVTVYESATGANPFCNGSRDQIESIRRAEQQALPRLLLTIPNGPKNEFADLITVMTQKRRDQRPRSVNEALAWARTIATSIGGP